MGTCSVKVYPKLGPLGKKLDKPNDMSRVWPCRKLIVSTSKRATAWGRPRTPWLLGRYDRTLKPIHLEVRVNTECSLEILMEKYVAYPIYNIYISHIEDRQRGIRHCAPLWPSLACVRCWEIVLGLLNFLYLFPPLDLHHIRLKVWRGWQAAKCPKGISPVMMIHADCTNSLPSTLALLSFVCLTPTGRVQRWTRGSVPPDTPKLASTHPQMSFIGLV